MTKPCKICQTIDHSRYRTSSYCRRCHIQKVSEKRKSDKIKKAQRFKDFMNVEKSKPCKDCGVKYPPCVMDFDHMPEFKKICDLSRMKHKSLERVREEISKCELVCSNCHRIRTNNRMSEL